MTFIAGKSVSVTADTVQTEQIPMTQDAAFATSRFASWRFAHLVNTHTSQTLTVTGTGIANSVIVAAGKELIFSIKYEGTLILTGSGASTTGVLTYGSIHG